MVPTPMHTYTYTHRHAIIVHLNYKVFLSYCQDIAVFTNDVSRCEYYQAESQNVKPRWACIIPSGLRKKNARTNNPIIPNNREDCEVRSGSGDSHKVELLLAPFFQFAQCGVNSSDLPLLFPIILKSLESVHTWLTSAV